MKTNIFILAIILSAIGTYIAYSTFHPIGFAIDGIGFMLFIYSIFPSSKEPVYSDKIQYRKSVYEDEYKCGNCRIFGNPGGSRKEKLINAQPCEEFIGKNKV
jgi:hypothetical protein